MTFSDIARWLLGRRESKPRPPRPSASFPAKGKSTRPSASFTAKEKSPGQHGAGQRAARHGRKRLGEVDEWRVDKEIDGFVVLAEGGDWTSCSDSDESDWSIGWFERLSSEFSSDNESDNSFAVLVPCYGPSSRKALNSRGKQNKETSILGMIQSNSSSKDSQKCVDKWLASLNGK
jgi:hypothetical protein